jgi:DNA replication protein DnaC
MKKRSIATMALGALIAGALVMGCNTSATKVENAQDNVTQAEKDLAKANEEYLADVEKYRQEAAVKIAANNQSIADFNARMANEKAEARADYKKKIDAIEQKNSDLKKKLEEYKAEGKDSWENFKSEFSRDMDELGTAFKNLTVKNSK